MSKTALVKIAKSKTAARKVASQLNLPDLDAAIRNLQAAKQFLAKQAAKKNDAQRARQIKKAMSMLDRMGLKPEDLGKSSKRTIRPIKKSSATRKVAAKYRITVNGVVTEWSGRGRMPVVFRDAAGKDGNLSRYLIKK
jgi:DNA-binding protein H-NS